MAKYKDARRLRSVSPSTLIGAGGEYSDFQSITDLLTAKTQSDVNLSDGHSLSARETWSYLRAVMYQRRSKMDPLWNDILVAGPDFLGFVNHIGTSYEDDCIATGFGSYIAMPILRAKWRPNMSYDEARALLVECQRVLFYRDCRALNRIQIGDVSRAGTCTVGEPETVDTNWDGASFAATKGGLNDDGGW